MSLKHNKKRNTGLISEFFAGYIARAIIEHRDEDLKKAREIYRKHFHKGTDLNRELRLFEALYETRVTNIEAARSLIQQVKDACKLQSQHKIDIEKGALLHEINSVLKDPTFFNKEIADFKLCATVQLLLNYWRGNLMSENISEAAQLEDKLLQHLTRKVVVLTENTQVLAMTNDDVDALVVKLMSEKLNTKFNATLTEDQKKILKFYVFANKSLEAKKELRSILEGIRTRTISWMDFSKKDISIKLDEITVKKLDEVKGLLLKEYKDITNLTDEMITFYLSVSKLEKELKDE